MISFIDGLNLYHAIARLRLPYLKWLDLRALSKLFIKSHTEELNKIYYFSTLATHTPPESQARQKAYITATELRNVQPVLGQFKRKDRYCPHCSSHWDGYEEKETDVNIALFLLDLAYCDAYDRALVISNDSDLAPAIRKVLDRFPNKKITIVAPPNSRQCNELIKSASDKTKIKLSHLERSLLPEIVSDASRYLYAVRPKEYAPFATIPHSDTIR